MSLATAIIGSDGIVLASDSKETENHGEYQRRNAHKITKICDSVWVACVSDYAEFTNRLLSDFINDISKLPIEEQEKLDVTVISRHFQYYANTEYEQLWHDPQSTFSSNLEVIFVGYTKDVAPKPLIRISRVRKETSLPPFALIETEDWWASGILQTAVYWIGKTEKVRLLRSVDAGTLRMLTILAFVETIKMTDLVGAPLDIITIASVGEANKVTISEIQLAKIRDELDTIIGEHTILDKLAELAGKTYGSQS